MFILIALFNFTKLPQYLELARAYAYQPLKTIYEILS